MFKNTLLFLLVLALSSSCESKPDFDIVPAITFQSITVVRLAADKAGPKRDSVIVATDYQDGDGDLGITQAEKDAKPSLQNYYLALFRKENGVYVRKNLTVFDNNQKKEVPFELGGAFRPLYKDNPNSPIKGLLRYANNFNTSSLTKPEQLTPGDSVRFELYITDRANHQSNIITTDAIRLSPN
jgi:hypothetical protein